MNYLTKIGSSIFQLSSLLFVLGYLFGVLNLHFSDRNDYCVMTYMFEYPQFVRISMPEDRKYPEYYSLYAYSEGRYTERARKMWFDGIPVLFLPGNSGSHMQVRSLASVALRMAISRNYEQHFDFYTIGYNEELSGLYGGILEYQTDFASACISKILSLYTKNKFTKSVPSSVILIGHSMGGVIAKRLMAYPTSFNTTSIAITLAAPLNTPVINIDEAMNLFYKHMESEWDHYINSKAVVREKKLMLSFGNGPRDVLMPSGLTSSNDSYVNTLTTAVPGVWVSPDHVSIVWCKQLVMAATKYLFAIIDPRTDQINQNTNIWKQTARNFFQANRSMLLDPSITRYNTTMVADAFWYEDSRRIYQISRPEIERMTYLMIRLVTFPQNRFVAIEAVNTDDKDWIFGCNAMYTYGTYRYCKHATSITELSRWTGAATGFGKRKLATINLHSLKDMYPEWSHVVVKISPTRKPIILNVDVNDHASRVITVNMPSDFSYGETVIIRETEAETLYYELILPNFNTVHQSYLLYVEPSVTCKASQYHVSAELHVPWAKNHEYSHYFTQLKRTPMKLRLFASNPNVTFGGEPSENVKVTLLLDPQCTYTVSISQSWYQRLAQLARNYTTVLVPYVVAVILLAARSSILNLKKNGSFISIHSALMSDGVMPYYVLVFARLASMVCVTIPILSYLYTAVSCQNIELQYFSRSLLVVPVYMTAVGIVNIGAAAVILVMVFSSQLAHRLLFRIIWRGGPSFAENVASGLQKIPIVVSLSLMCLGQYFCDAIALFAGAAFYAFLLSKMYEEYLEDYVYKLMAKIASRICYAFKTKKEETKNNEVELSLSNTSAEVLSTDDISNNSHDVSDKKVITTTEDTKTSRDECDKAISTNEGSKNPLDESDKKVLTANEDYKNSRDESDKRIEVDKNDHKTVAVPTIDINQKTELKKEKRDEKPQRQMSNDSNGDDDLSTLNYHVLMFLLWACVALLNVPPLLTWARTYKFVKALRPDTSHPVGLIMSTCSIYLWQMRGPRKNLRYYETVANLLFITAIVMLAVGPVSLFIVKYGAAFMFTVICLQQAYDKEETFSIETINVEDITVDKTETPKENENSSINDDSVNTKENNKNSEDNTDTNSKNNERETKETSPESNCDVCNENRIYRVFKNFKDKFSFAQDP